MPDYPKTRSGLVTTMAAGILLCAIGVFLVLGPLEFFGLFAVLAGWIFISVAWPGLEKLCLAYHWPGQMDDLREVLFYVFSVARGGVVYLLFRFLSNAFANDTHFHSPSYFDGPPERRIAQLLLLFLCGSAVISLFAPILRSLNRVLATKHPAERLRIQSRKADVDGSLRAWIDAGILGSWPDRAS